MAIPRALEPSGLVLVDKEAGPSSFQIVRDFRTRTGARAGHAGTLDPFASGLLLVLLGASTKLARYLVGLDKRYLTDIDLHRRTTSGDPEGELLEEREPPGREELERRLSALHGEVELAVPALSAVKIEGERAYRRARRGEEPQMPVRRSHLHTLELLDYSDGIARIDLTVGSGTYVRSLADALGGHCLSLRRLEVGPFSVTEADGERIVPPEQALAFLPAIELSEEEAGAVHNGRRVSRVEEGRLRMLRDGRLIAVGYGKEGTVHPETVMPA